MDVTLRNLDGMLLVLVRVSAIIMVAPFFNQTTIPRRTKFFLSFFLFFFAFVVRLWNLDCRILIGFFLSI